MISDNSILEKAECDHDWEDISEIGSSVRALVCTYCGQEKTEPFELNANRWADDEETE